MRRRRLSNLLAALSLLLCAAVCVLWFRGRSGYDQVLWSYDRWLADRSAASNHVELRSDSRLWLTISGGHVGPFNGQLVWGYYVNADQSRGRPRLTLQHDEYDPLTKYLMSAAAGGKSSAAAESVPGFGPLRFGRWTRTAARDGDDATTICLGLSHWLAATLLALLPARAAWRISRDRRRRRAGRCAACGYDLRATPERCPECGAVPKAHGPAAAALARTD